MTTKTKPLYEKRGELLTQAAEILDLAEGEGRELTTDEESKWDAINDDINAVEQRIARIEKLDEMTEKKVEEIEQKAVEQKANEDDTVKYVDVFRSWVKGGLGALTADERAVLRAQSVGTNTAGGFTVPQEFSDEVTAALAEWGGMREVARIITTSTGGQIDWPVYDDTGNSGALLAENTQNSQQDITFANKNLDAYKYTSKEIYVSSELLQDSFFSIENDILRPAFGRRIGAAVNAHYTTGSGSGQPNGVITAATVGKTAASATAITFGELFDLLHSVDPAYRKGTSVAWMFNDTTLKAIRKLKDAENRYIWQGSVDGTNPATILGHRYVINQDVADIGASGKCVAFGDFSYYVIRDVAPLSFRRSEHFRFDYDQTAFVAFMRTDGELMSNGAPIKVLQNASS